MKKLCGHTQSLSEWGRVRPVVSRTFGPPPPRYEHPHPLYYLKAFPILIPWAELYPILIHWTEPYPILVHWTELYPILIHWAELYLILIHYSRQPINIEHYVSQVVSQSESSITSPGSSRLRLKTLLGSWLESAHYSQSWYIGSSNPPPPTSSANSSTTNGPFFSYFYPVWLIFVVL